jgi:predicted nucleic acid-binding protein
LRVYFFDTCALVPRYVKGKFTRRVNLVLSGADRAVYICELTVIEMSSALAKIYRKDSLSVSDFAQMRAQFEDDIASGLLRVQAVCQADLLSARDLLEDAAVLNSRDLRSADAIIAATCRGLAYSMDKSVTFYTRDWLLYSSIRSVQSYRSTLKLRYLGRGKGGVPPKTG